MRSKGVSVAKTSSIACRCASTMAACASTTSSASTSCASAIASSGRAASCTAFELSLVALTQAFDLARDHAAADAFALQGDDGHDAVDREPEAPAQQWEVRPARLAGHR